LALLTQHLLDFTLGLPTVSLAGIWLGAGLTGAARLPAPPARTRWARVGAGIGAALLIGSGVWAMRVEWVAWRGWLAGLEGDWRSAADRYAEAARLDPALLIYRLDRAYALGEVGLEGDSDALTEAIEEYRAILDQEPNFALNWANLGLLLHASGDADGARLAARRALELAPEDGAVEALVECVESGECDAERVAELTIALREPPRPPDFSSRCADALRGNPITRSRQAVELGLLCAADGETEVAVRLLEAAQLLASKQHERNALAGLDESIGDLPDDPEAARRVWEAYNVAAVPDPLAGLYGASIGYSRFVFRRPGVPGVLIGGE
jgi:tetratricopeptide (TPR) repeat protein